MGKSTCGRMLTRLGLPVLSADKIVHDLLAQGGVVEKKVAALYPQVCGKNGISRKKLASLVFSNPQIIAWLESLLHPLVFKACRAFIRQATQAGAPAVVLEIPLLFETGFDAACDVVVCASARAAVQKERVMKRAHMTVQKFRAVRRKQMSDTEKRKRADYVIRTDQGFAQARLQILTVWADIQRKRG